MLRRRNGRISRRRAAASVATAARIVCSTSPTDIRCSRPAGISTFGPSPGTYPQAVTTAAARDTRAIAGHDRG
jgi:hypothetical protein